MSDLCRPFRWLLFLALAAASGLQAQTLLNVHFGAGTLSPKTGFAATGLATNDFWNLYRHYEPRFLPGMPPVANGRLENLKLADGSPSKIAVAVTNAPGVWGNASGDPLLDSYIFAPNGSNIVVTITGLDPGRYHFHLYGWAAADVAAEQNSVFTLHAGTHHLGPVTASGATGWQAGQPWRERAQFTVFRDVALESGQSVTLEVAPGPGGIAVLNGLQILSRGTGAPRLTLAAPNPAGPAVTNLLLREIRYTGRIDDSGAVFQVTLDAESRTTNELSTVLFEGDVALLEPKLPAGWRLLPAPGRLLLAASVPGNHRLEFELRPKVQRAEPWQQFSLIGPAAAIATVTATTDRPNLELQLLSGTSLASEQTRTNSVQGVLGADRRLALRWQSRTTEVTREAVVAADTRVTMDLTPTAARLTTVIRHEVLQGRLTRLRLALPPEQTLTRIEADALRDWKVEELNGKPVINIEFLRPVDGVVTVTLLTEQALGALPADIAVPLPAPLAVQRETGSVQVRTEDVTARFDAIEGLRQVNAGAGEAAAFRFNARPVVLRAHLTRVAPDLAVNARVIGRLEDTRFAVQHQLNLDVTRAGIYALEAVLPTGFTVTSVKADGLEDWKAENGRLKFQFAQRVLGARVLNVELEQSFTTIPPTLTLDPLRLTGATRENTVLGAAAQPGLQLKTSTATGARELPVSALPNRTDELLAFRADRPDWRILLQAGRLDARVVADVFNLVTVGDGVVGGSATLRFALVNQGVQQFRVRLPAHWRNIEFTGANIRRQDHTGDLWTLALQDKVWGAYTLVVTYDSTFDPKVGTVDAAGAHAPDAERETGSVAITAAPGLTLTPGPLADPLRPLDPGELADADRSLISRPVLHAARYSGTNYIWSLHATRHDQIPLLDAVADRAQLTSVVTEEGEMLTSASFMVKNNDRQFQRFRLPAGSTLWGVAVNGEPTKADRDGDFVVIALPRSEDRDRTFAIDLKYAQQLGRLGGWWPRKLDLQAPGSDIEGTYAEWQLYVPNSRRASGFEGTMMVARGTTYGVRDGWDEFVRTYKSVWIEYGAGIVIITLVLAFLIGAVVAGKRHGFPGLAKVAVITCILAIFAGMLLPALAKAKAKAQRIKSVNNLKNIGLAARIFAADHNGQMPATLADMIAELGSPALIIDPETGQTYTWIGAGKSEENPQQILAYSPIREGHGEILLADGSVQQVTESRFQEALAEDARASGKPAIAMAPALMRRYGLLSRSDNARQAAEAAPETPPAPVAPPSPILNRPIGGMAGGQGGGGAGGQGGQGSVLAPAAPPAVAGLRSLQIDIPKSGHALRFTRVLNLNGDAAAVRFSIMSARAHDLLETLLQVAAFLAGLLLTWFQWRREKPSLPWLTAGVALALFGLTELFVTWRALHLVLILGVPLAIGLPLLFIIGRLLRRRFPRRPSGPPGPPTPPVQPTVPSRPDGPANLPGTTLTASTSASASVSALAALLLVLVTVGIGPRAEAQSITNLVSLVSATYQGIAGERAAEFEAVLEFQSAGTNQTFSLFGPEIAVQHFAVTNGEAQLWRDGDRVGVLLPQRGSATIKARFLVRVGGDVTRRQLEFDLPPALASRVGLVVPEPDADLEFPAAVSLQRHTETNTTRMDAVLGPVPRLAISWTPRTRRAADVAVNAFGRQATLVTFAGGVVNLRGIHDLQAAQGELRQLRLIIPAGQRLLRVTGDAVRGWDYADTNRQEILVELIKPAATAHLTVETEAGLDALPATLEFALPHFAGLKRESGTVAVRASDDLGLTAERITGLDRIEPAEFAKSAGADPGPLFSAWRFQQPDPRLGLHIEVLQSRLEASTRHQFTLGADQSTLAAVINLEVKRAGIFALRLPLPEGWRLDAVRSAALRNWNERTESGRRVAEVELKERTLGKFELQLDLSQVRSNLPPRLELTGLDIPGLTREDGVVTVATEAGVSAKTAQLRRLTEIPAATLGRPSAPGTTLLAFKFVRTDATDTNRWALSLDTEQLAAVVRAETAQFITFSEPLLAGRTVIRYAIENAPVQEFRLHVPAGWRNVEINGAGIRRRDQNTNDWRIELQNKVRGEYLLSVTWDSPRIPGATNAVNLQGLTTVGTERETGTVALLATGQLQLTPSPSGDALIRIDTRELPPWARGASTAVAAFRYVRPGWDLAVEARRFTEAAVLQVLVEQVRLRTVVADHGEAMTQMDLRVRNNGLQNLTVWLPKGATVWSAFVGGEAVRPAREGDAVLLPLEGAGADTAVTVELTYVVAGQFQHGGGRVRFESPRFHAPLKDAHWELFLPPDYDYDSFEGSMIHDLNALVPVEQDFTIAEYARQENAQVATVQTEAKDALSKARQEIAAGNYGFVERLTQNNRRSGNTGKRDAETSRELKQLETDFNRIQSSNFINGQNSFSAQNPLGNGEIPAANNANNDYDARVAEQQVEQLRKAQTVAVTRVQPLRVTLPTRGLRYNFTQVLQTGFDKPLTISLRAKSTRELGWLAWTGLWVGGFLALWIACAVAVGLRRPRA